MRTALWCALAISGMVTGKLWAESKPVSIENLPKIVTDAVSKMFPKAKLIEATVESEEGESEYEVTIKDDGKKIDVKVEADGDIEEFEKEIDVKDLPTAVTVALEKKYPKAVLNSAEAIYEVEKGKAEFEFYEVQLKSADGKEVEVMIKADGTIVKNADNEKK